MGYSYDMNGRRIQTNLPDGTSWRYGYDRLSQAVPETPSYDADGNMLSNDGWTYAWNAQDRLVSAAKGAIRLELAYDYMGRRFEKKAFENNVLTKRSLYAYDGFKQIAEFDALDNNALLNTYIWQPAGLDVPLLRNGSEFYVSDANKNVVALMDTTGAVTDTYVYDPFGNCAHAGTSANPFRFSSEYHDDETGLVYYNYRYYNPEQGRWIKRDPIGEDGGVNLYSLLDNTTLNNYDDKGLWLGKAHRFYTRQAFYQVIFPILFSFQIHSVSPLEDIINVIKKANVDTDKGEKGNDQSFHFCTDYEKISGPKESVWAYSKKLNYMLGKFTKDVENENCEDALKNLGILSHMWQDYYAHGVEYDEHLHGDFAAAKTSNERAIGTKSIIGKIKGTPYTPQMEPVTFGNNGLLGSHGGPFKILSTNSIDMLEPGNRADDYLDRQQKAIEFTALQFRSLLPGWVFKCKCHYWKK